MTSNRVLKMFPDFTFILFEEIVFTFKRNTLCRRKYKIFTKNLPFIDILISRIKKNKYKQVLLYYTFEEKTISDIKLQYSNTIKYFNKSDT